MNGKVIAMFLIGTAAIGGAAMYWLQVHAFYERVSADQVDILLTNVATGQPEPIPVSGLQAIDAGSSPLRFRACFTTAYSTPTLTETYVIKDDAVPLVAPGWFDCFDAAAIGAALEEGRAIAYLGQRDISDGVDRVVAVFDDGRAYAWHQLNETYKD
ncbi:MAG: DUF6446 family protein [Paracoccaceae bacterium]|jgi:hypothetical protein